MKGSNPPPHTAIHQIKLTIRRGVGKGRGYFELHSLNIVLVLLKKRTELKSAFDAMSFKYLSSADHLDRVSTTPENFNLSPPLTSPPRTHSFVYSTKTVDHPMRKLKVFCLPVYLNIG